MGTVFRQELQLRLRQASTWGYFLFILLVAATIMSSERSENTGGRVHANAPSQLLLFSSIFCLIIGPLIAAVAGTAVYRDYELRVHELFFTTRVKPWQYFFGRYFGSFAITALIFIALPLGFWLGTALPGDRTHLGPFRLDAYVFTYAVVLLPNLLLTSSLFFVAGALTRNLFAIYALGIALFVCYLVAAAVSSGIDNRALAAVIDPYGITVTNIETQYWTPAQKNAQLPALGGPLVFNRLLWSGLAIGILALGNLLFRFRALPPQLSQRTTASSTPPPRTPPTSLKLLHSTRTTFFHLLRFHLRLILKSWPYWLFLVLGAFAVGILFDQEDSASGTTLLPLTKQIAKEVSEGYVALFILVSAIYAGELVWQERVLRIAPLTETTPVSRAVAALARFVALQLLLILAGLVMIATGILHQLWNGVTPELPVYAVSVLGISGVMLFCFSAVAFALQTLAPNKFAGHLFIVMLVLFPTVVQELGWAHPLLDIGSLGEPTYSDLDGWGAFVPQILGLGTHWLLLSGVLLCVAVRLWRFGDDARLRTRWHQGKPGAAGQLIFGVLCLGYLASGGWVLWNVHVWNEFSNAARLEQDQADYERRFRTTWLQAPQPRIVAIELDAALWPERRQFSLKGHYDLRNQNTVPVTEVLVNLDSDLTVQALGFDRPATRTLWDRRQGVQVYRLAQPLSPGGKLRLDFALAWDKKGFPAGSPRLDIAQNGTFLRAIAPQLGYQRDVELTEPAERQKQKLGSRLPLPESLGRRNTYIGSDADWVDFRATIRTAPDQLALAPGTLVRQWSEGGRSCFRYETSKPIRNFWAIVSGRYATKQTRWRAPDGRTIPVKVYYHPGHPWNVERLLKGAVASLAYCSKAYSPYAFSELRIIEFPARGEDVAAQAFAGTIPYSEDGGFSYQVGEDDFDSPFYVTAHEVAHQWWAHQVVGADLPGSEVLAESLAEYTALQVMEETGSSSTEYLRRAADQYLKGRSEAHEEEKPLVTTVNQPYLCYQRGGLAFHELSWRSSRLNQILQTFLRRHAFGNPPYPITQELVDLLKRELPSERQRLSDLFEKITLVDFQAQSASTKSLGLQRWRTTFRLRSKKVYADGQGNETQAPLREQVAIRMRGESRSVVSFVWVTESDQKLTLESRFPPRTLTVDPAYHFLDRDVSDNTCSVAQP